MWDRWQKGDSTYAIARLFDRGHSSVQRVLGETGGIRPPENKEVKTGTKVVGTRTYLARCCGGSIDPIHCFSFGAGSVYGESRDQS